MRVALLQQNFIVGDLEGNTKKIREGYLDAVRKGADLVVSSELAIFGYPPRDLLEHKNLVEKQTALLHDLTRYVGDAALVVGYAEPNSEARGKSLFNSAAFLRDGKIYDIRRKALLPTYDVFDEHRYFEPYINPQEPILHRGGKIGILICEDIWGESNNPVVRNQYLIDPVKDICMKGINMLLVINGSPYFWGKGDLRFVLVEGIAKKYGLSVGYVNQTGANDELIFDGRSFVVNAKGTCVGAAKSFEEDIIIVDPESPGLTPYVRDTGNMSQVENALILGVRDYCEKTGVIKNGVAIGLSGGIDSALTACIAQKALGSGKVIGLSMPSGYSSKESVEDAKRLAENLGIELRIVPIRDVFSAFEDALKPTIGWHDPPEVTEENIQARIRGMFLMATANREGRIVLGTGNKSELAVGYATLYGDMASGLGVISDLPKTLVYRLASYINREKEIIPERIIEKPPSAELKPGQKDTDSLPPYDILDAILEQYIEERKGTREINQTILNREVVEKVINMVNRAEFKRRQMAPGLKITTKAFGSGRRMPIAARISA